MNIDKHIALPLLLALVLIFFGCGGGGDGSGDVPSSSSNTVNNNFCYYAETNRCFDVGSNITTCPGGGEFRSSCPSAEQSSSSEQASSSSLQPGEVLCLVGTTCIPINAEYCSQIGNQVDSCPVEQSSSSSQPPLSSYEPPPPPPPDANVSYDARINTTNINSGTIGLTFIVGIEDLSANAISLSNVKITINGIGEYYNEAWTKEDRMQDFTLPSNKRMLDVSDNAIQCGVPYQVYFEAYTWKQSGTPDSLIVFADGTFTKDPDIFCRVIEPPSSSSYVPELNIPLSQITFDGADDITLNTGAGDRGINLASGTGAGTNGDIYLAIVNGEFVLRAGREGVKIIEQFIRPGTTSCNMLFKAHVANVNNASQFKLCSGAALNHSIKDEVYYDKDQYYLVRTNGASDEWDGYYIVLAVTTPEGSGANYNVKVSAWTKPSNIIYVSSSSLVPSSSSLVPSSSSLVPSSSSLVPSSSSSTGSLTESSSSNNIVYGESVIYEGETYETVVIGTQTWFARNLNYAVVGSKCGGSDGYLTDSNTEFCNTYGRLYDWVTAMALPSDCNASECASQVQTKHQGICPTGWHVPSGADWQILMNFIDGTSLTSPASSSTAGRYLKATSGWNSYSGVPHGQDTYGFAALPGGYGGSDGYFNSVGDYGYWCSATEYNAYYAYGRFMSYLGEGALWYDNYKTGLHSVRCVQD